MRAVNTASAKHDPSDSDQGRELDRHVWGEGARIDLPAQETAGWLTASETRARQIWLRHGWAAPDLVAPSPAAINARLNLG
jgi:hypothetical protein